MFSLFAHLFTWLAQTAPAVPAMVPDSVQKANWTQFVARISNLDEQQVKDWFMGMLSGAMGWVVKILIAVVVYLIGRWIIRRILRIVERAMARHEVEMSLRKFLHNLLKAVLTLLLLLIIIQTLGINLTVLVALASVVTLAIGMALSGTAQNFAGGVMILLMKPYRIGDTISAQGQTGVIQEIRLFSTVILTFDNQTIFIPNNTIATSIVDNYSSASLRRAEWTLPISSGTDIDLIRKEIFAIFAADNRIVQDPAPAVWITAIDGSTLTISARAWTGNADYWDVMFQTYDTFYKTLPQKGIPFSYQQVELIQKQTTKQIPTEK